MLRRDPVTVTELMTEMSLSTGTAAAAANIKRVFTVFSTLLRHFYKDSTTCSPRLVYQQTFAMAVIGKWTDGLWRLTVFERECFSNNLWFVENSELLLNTFRKSPYHYVPSESIAITFIVLFGLSTGKILFFFFCTICVNSFVLNLSWTLPSSSLEPSYFLPHVVAVSYHWSLWCARGLWMVRSTLVKFFTLTRHTIQNSVSIHFFIHFITVRLMGILIILELLQPS